jgi:hypothetical protein
MFRTFALLEFNPLLMLALFAQVETFNGAVVAHYARENLTFRALRAFADRGDHFRDRLLFIAHLANLSMLPNNAAVSVVQAAISPSTSRAKKRVGSHFAGA